MTINDLECLCYIQEQTSFEEDYMNNFGYQVFDKGSRFYLIFDAVLQSFGIKNRNGREYDLDNIRDKINTDIYIQDQLRKNCWMGEIDHPAPLFKGDELTMQRIANPDPKLTSHYIRKPRFNANLLEATIQTDSATDAGMNMAIKIVDGKIIPCFSARVLGALRNMMGRMVVFVNKLVTYDWVLFPSHPEAEAKIKQPMIESVDTLAKYAGAKVIFLKELAQAAAEDTKEIQLICESFGLTFDDILGVTESGNSIVMADGKNAFMQPITDKYIREKTQNNVKDWLNS